MATLVLSAVGTALGGPVGGALGSLVGQAVDQQLFGSGPRRGPRLGDLTIQTASYGTMIPRIYGTMRVAGSLIWATDLKEGEQAVSGGKGGSDSLRYSYTASFAVALSSRRTVRIGRIWADGKLLRGAAGDLKVAGTVRFHDGGEGQAVDPLIAAVEGAGATSAFRGLALAVFEDLALAEYGNRIPLLTFEVVGDEGAVEVGAVIGDASGGVIDSGAVAALSGYAAHGSDRRGAVTPIVEMFGLRLRDEGVVVGDRRAVSRTVAEADPGSAVAEKGAAKMARSRRPLGEMPAGLGLGYYDPARDYQSGRAGAGEAGGRTHLSVDLAAVLTVDAARALAEARLARMWAERERAVVQLPPAFIDLQPGDTVRGAGLTGDWDVASVEVTALVVTAELVRRSGGAAALAADGGRASGSADVAASATRLVLLDLPDLGTGEAGPTLMIAASSAGACRPVVVRITANGSERAMVTINRAAIVGAVTSALAVGSTAVRDDVSSVVVQLVNCDAWLTSCDDDALAMGTNLAALGDELIQFGQADMIGAGRFRLSRLLRGRRGSEWAMAGHGVGEMFVLIEADRLTPVTLPGEMVGAEVAALAQGLGDGAAVAARRVAGGEALRPPSPCAVNAVGNAGGLRIEWVRRSRFGWGWSDGVDAPLGEALEHYQVRIAAGAVERVWDSDAPMLVLAASELSPFDAGVVSISVVQVGDRAVSRAAVIIVTL
ncbi:phage tail protein [Sphingomonas sp.]|uniref:GTA baseplate fiber-binding domain-containing protein n=1 Tax=Sphingomonas sp. TaxID=28214 RepID=UPI0025FAFABE|nr:phage tail protein [Sphingomonas sp.]